MGTTGTTAIRLSLEVLSASRAHPPSLRAQCSTPTRIPRIQHRPYRQLSQGMSRSGKLAPEVNRALFVKNLNFQVTPEELFDLFGRFGAIRQIRQGIANNTKGTAFVVFEDVMDAKSACDKLNGFNFQNRYLVVLYHQPEKMVKAQADLAERQESLEKLKREHGIE